MKLLITGGAGFLGARLAREILKKGELNGHKVTELHIADLFPAPADLLADSRVKGHAGPMLEQGALFQSGLMACFIWPLPCLASASKTLIWACVPT